MRCIGVAGIVGVFVVTVACGGPSPQSDCDNMVSTYCNKIFQCLPTSGTTVYGSEGDCETQMRSATNCAAWSCPSGETYNGAQIEACTNAISAETCAELESASSSPSACQNITAATCS